MLRDRALEWSDEMRREVGAARGPKWPNEPMVKIIFGDYLRKPFTLPCGARVLDVGCFFGNNISPFADACYECYGIDLHEDIIKVAETACLNRGYKATFKIGSNRKIPYPDGYFDLILSISTLHYEGVEDGVISALAEFKRVLKPGGGLYISTVGPKHEMFIKATRLKRHQYVVQNYDFRNGEKFFFFEDVDTLQLHCQKFFDNVETGRVTESLMTTTTDHLIAFCR